jgi:hypothetical protein
LRWENSWDRANELAKYGPDAHIIEFVSGGPKNYAYVIRIGPNEYKTVCKVRGITINYRNRDAVCFHSLRDMILFEAPSTAVPIPHKIARHKAGVVVTRPESKTYRVVYNKRRRVDGYDTLPFGTKRQKN